MSSPPAPARRARVPAWVVWSLRVTATLHLVTVLGQAVIAGMFVTGKVDLLAHHNLNAFVTTALVGLQLIAAITLWRPGRGPLWPLWVSVLQVALVNAQIVLGQERLVAPHFPLAMVIFGLAVSMTAWTWRGQRRAAA
jgi:heme A synthase